MNTERFEQLKGSLIEAGRIVRGEQKPSREFRFEVVDNPGPSEERWAICMDSDDHQLLIPRKLYLVRFGETGAWVRDENGEMTVCDAEDFVPVAFDSEVSKRLDHAA